MSDVEGYDGGDVDYGHYQEGQEHDALDQLHHASGHEADASSQYGVYEQDHHAAEADTFATGHQVHYEAPASVEYDESDFTNATHTAEVDDHVFAAEGSEHAHEAGFDQLDALSQRFDGAFAEGTEFHGGEGHLGVASS